MVHDIAKVKAELDGFCSLVFPLGDSSLDGDTPSLGPACQALLGAQAPTQVFAEMAFRGPEYRAPADDSASKQTSASMASFLLNKNQDKSATEPCQAEIGRAHV